VPRQSLTPRRWFERVLGMALLVAALAAPAGATGDDGRTAAASASPGRRPAADASVLQSRVDAAAPGDTVLVEAGTYRGDLVIDKPLRLVGRGRPLILGSGRGTVLSVQSADVTVEGLDIDGRAGGDLGRDPSGIHIAARRVTVRDCRIRQTLFGIYLREAHGAVVTGCRIRGIRGKDPGEKGSGIHVWNTQGFLLEGNDIADVRDGFYIQSSSHGRVIRNTASDLRYGLHYMFSDDNSFEENTFERGAAGTALMYSRRVTFRRNRFLRNRGFASVGLLLKTCDDVLAEDNLIADNARGVFVEGSARNVFRRNIVAASDTAIVLYDSVSGSRFEENAFVANRSPLLLVGRRTDTVFAGNYWSEHRAADLDGDGVGDSPFVLSNVFDHMRGNLSAADLYVDGFAAASMAMAERSFPVLETVAAQDDAPLAVMPRLDRVPIRPPQPRAGARPLGLVGSLALFALGLGVMAAAWLPSNRQN
jgi:nitrous oxidase accessory protein